MTWRGPPIEEMGTSVLQPWGLDSADPLSELGGGSFPGGAPEGDAAGSALMGARPTLSRRPATPLWTLTH